MSKLIRDFRHFTRYEDLAAQFESPKDAWEECEVAGWLLSVAYQRGLLTETVSVDLAERFARHLNSTTPRRYQSLNALHPDATNAVESIRRAPNARERYYRLSRYADACAREYAQRECRLDGRHGMGPDVGSFAIRESKWQCNTIRSAVTLVVE